MRRGCCENKIYDMTHTQNLNISEPPFFPPPPNLTTTLATFESRLGWRSPLLPTLPTALSHASPSSASSSRVCSSLAALLFSLLPTTKPLRLFPLQRSRSCVLGGLELHKVHGGPRRGALVGCGRGWVLRLIGPTSGNIKVYILRINIIIGLILNISSFIIYFSNILRFVFK